MMKKFILAFTFSFLAISANATLTAPTLSGPSDGATVIMPEVLLDWGPVSGANMYRVEYDTSSTFSNPLTATVGATAYQVSELYFGATYYWRVKAIGPSDSSMYSDTSSFSVFYDEFTLTAPNDINGSGVASGTITIDQNNYIGNDTVVVDGVQLVEGVDFTMGANATATATALANAINSNVTLNATVTASASGNVVTVMANSPGTAGNSISLSYINSPTSNAIDLFGDSLDLGNPPGVYASDTIYIVNNSVLSGDSLLVYDQTGTKKMLIEGTDFTMGANAGASATAIATAINNKANLMDSVTATAAGTSIIVTADTAGTWGEGILFAYSHVDYQAVSLSGGSLSGGAEPIDHVQTTLNWDDITGITNYEYQLDTNSAFGSPEMESGLRPSDTSDVAVTHLRFNTVYYWRIRAMHGKDTSGWSVTASFYTPKTVDLQSPSDGNQGNHPITQLKWKQMKGSTEYAAQWDTTMNFNSILFDDDDPVTNSTSTQKLLFGTTYYWRVKAKNPKDTSIWSDIWSFETLDKVPHVSPSNGSTVSSMNPTLEWDSIAGASRYYYQYSTDSTFALATTYAVNANNGPGEAITIPSTDSGITYYWRVKAMHNQDTTQWSDPWEFAAPAPVGINTHELISEVRIYPNPASNNVTVLVRSKAGLTSQLLIRDVAGKVVHGESFDLNAGEQRKTIQLGHLSSGIYHIRLQGGNDILFDDKLIMTR